MPFSQAPDYVIFIYSINCNPFHYTQADSLTTPEFSQIATPVSWLRFNERIRRFNIMQGFWEYNTIITFNDNETRN
jgi:hypothetical protein